MIQTALLFECLLYLYARSSFGSDVVVLPVQHALMGWSKPCDHSSQYESLCRGTEQMSSEVAEHHKLERYWHRRRLREDLEEYSLYIQSKVEVAMVLEIESALLEQIERVALHLSVLL